jgi:threonine/homoserine/homoserine lactone efflux protein
MNINLLAAFLIGMIILAATPGPGVFASMAKAIAEGFKASLFLIGGLVTGDIIFLLFALFGLSAIANVAGKLFLAIKIVGGLYLMYLGIRILKSNLSQICIQSKQDTNRLQTFTSGFLVTMGNPKPILFYASVLPAIINFQEVKPFDVLVMVILIALVSFTVLGMYSYIASLSNKMNVNSRWNKRIHQIAGLVMITVGLFVILK